jgi:hypothetical protein
MGKLFPAISFVGYDESENFYSNSLAILSDGFYRLRGTQQPVEYTYKIYDEGNFLAGTHYLSPSGPGSNLTGITAAQVGSVATNDARYLASLTNLTAAAIVAAGAVTNNGVTINGVGLTNGLSLTVVAAASIAITDQFNCAVSTPFQWLTNGVSQVLKAQTNIFGTGVLSDQGTAATVTFTSAGYCQINAMVLSSLADGKYLDIGLLCNGVLVPGWDVTSMSSTTTAYGASTLAGLIYNTHATNTYTIMATITDTTRRQPYFSFSGYRFKNTGE